MLTLILTRHGHVEGITPERFRGRTDLSLTSEGVTQAKRLAKYIKSEWAPTLILSSPMRRCMETGQHIAQMCDLSLQTLDGLNDLDYGDWQYRTHAEIETVEPQLYATWTRAPHLVRFPGGESLQDVAARTANVLRMVRAEYVDQVIVLVGHDSVNRVLLTQFLDLSLSAYWRIDQGPCCVNHIDVDASGYRIRSINVTQHLNG